MSELKNNINHISCPVNAQRYHYSGERSSIPYSRNDFYKIWLIESEGRLHFNDKTVYIDKPALFFSNPLVPYAYDGLCKERTGYWCVFKKDFLNALDLKRNMHASPIFNIENMDVFFPDEEQLSVIKNLFTQIIIQLDSSFPFKDDMVRNYIHLLIYEGLKAQNISAFNHDSNAAIRIAKLFLDLLDKQFPIQSPEQPLKLKTAKDFALLLAVHVNHLNAMVNDITGKSTTIHITERITNEAKALLKHSEWNVADIGYALGFDYPNHFTTYFKKHTGNSPSTYRKNIIL